MTDKRKAIRLAALAILILFGGLLLALFVPRFQVGIVAMSFVGYVACTRETIALCHANEMVFVSRGASSRDAEAREAVRAGLIAGSSGALSLARSVSRLSLVERRAKRRAPSEFPRPLEGIR